MNFNLRICYLSLYRFNARLYKHIQYVAASHLAVFAFRVYWDSFKVLQVKWFVLWYISYSYFKTHFKILIFISKIFLDFTVFLLVIFMYLIIFSKKIFRAVLKVFLRQSEEGAINDTDGYGLCDYSFSFYKNLFVL